MKQLSLFQMEEDENLLQGLFQAYFDARKNKRNTLNALAFEKSFEENIFQLYEELLSGRYLPSRSICFIVKHPVKREIFAAHFRDRVVHHLIFNNIAPLFDGTFIHDSYSCRVGKGTHYGIKRVDHFIRSCSQNYSKEAFILKLDIQGYFMAINHKILFEIIKKTLLLKKKRIEFILPFVLDLIKKTIINDSTKNCIVKGKRSNWEGLPKDKSLFTVKKGCGLPIGNLTSQLFGNIYLNALDHFIKRDLNIKYYGRYVDDIILVHSDKSCLKNSIPVIRKFLKTNLNLRLHEKKIYLQHYSKGVKWLGAVIKPHRIYIANRTKGRFFEKIELQNKRIRSQKPSWEEREKFREIMNAYLGILSHYKTYKIRQTFLFNHLSVWWWNIAYVEGGLQKMVLK